ncbi:tyrosine-protein phosphatase [Ornithinibacillus californiensis]|uniref:tyrosine-protein phosphatase n=1 Tax=Ornithinibacillus californiensis TaxID=161536 RepID=UPI00069EC4E5|nr:CpsB/CapC family capsule biosynthesis tyrosine phosphatase [Ornithinibacillus californiensis]
MIVDIHNHILPGVDDGPKDWDEMILLANQAVEVGITDVIATPHHKHQHGEHYYENDPIIIQSLVNQANLILKENQIPLTIHPGIEFHIHPDILEDMKSMETFLPLNHTRFLLMEPPSKYFPENTEEVFLRLQEKGYTPILAHPERNRILRREPEKIFNLVKRGALIQVTAASIIGTGKRLKNFSHHLLEHNLVHLIASDAHHHLRRRFELNNAYQYLEENYSRDYSEYFISNAELVLKGEVISIRDPHEIGKRRQYFFFYNHPLNIK